MHRLRGGIDEEGNLVSWTDRIADTTIIGQHDPRQAQAYELGGAVDHPYPGAAFPHVLCARRERRDPRSLARGRN